MSANSPQSLPSPEVATSSKLISVGSETSSAANVTKRSLTVLEKEMELLKFRGLNAVLTAYALVVCLIEPFLALPLPPSPFPLSNLFSLSQELMSLMMACPAGISAFPVSDSDLTFWKGRIDGADGTVFENQTYAISLQFPPTYPYAAPVVRFETTCYHPNVDLFGNICLDILKEKWSPMLSVSTILMSIQSLLGEPNNRSPLNVEAADLWDNVEAYKKELAKHYKPIVDDDE